MEKMSESLEICDIPGDDLGQVFVGEKKYVWPRVEKEAAETLSNFQARPNDVFIMTLPRSGTTLTQEIAWLLMNNLDYENAKKFHLQERVPVLAIGSRLGTYKSSKVAFRNPDNQNIFETIECDVSNLYELYERIPGPRIFKTHVTFSILKNVLKSGAKTIYVARGQKDRFVSFYRMINAGENPFHKCDIKQLWNKYKTKTDFFGPTWEHLKEGWAQRNNPNVLFLFYEDMRADLPAVLKKIATFLGKTYSDEEFQTLSTHLDIENFRKNPSVNVLEGFPSTDSCFIGSGKVGGYKDVIPPEIEKEMDEWIAENIRDTDFEFPSMKE